MNLAVLQINSSLDRPDWEGSAMRETVAGESTGVEQLTVAAGRAPVPVPGEAGAAWVDLLNPTPEQDREVLARLGEDIPTHEEMEEIESSSRTTRR